MKAKSPMKVVGGRNLSSHWERFDRLQRTTNKLLAGRRVAKRGVVRFSSFEEFNQWKMSQALHGSPNKPTL
jgi:hypothetical protein